MSDAFLNKFLNAYNDSFPLETVKYNKYKHRLNKWITKGILISIKSKDTKYTKLVKEKNKCKQTILLEQFRNYRNILNKSIRLAKTKYWEIKFEESKGNMKETWTQIKHLINKNNNKCDFPKIINSKDGHELNCEESIANSFNAYFSNVGSNLADNMPAISGNALQYLNESKVKPPVGSLLLHPTTTDEILKTVKALKNKSSCGTDHISPKLIKCCIYSIIDPLKSIINASLETGQFPEAFKLAKVIPVYKKNNKKDMTNYRPISILSTFSKIIEKIVHKRLYSFMIKHNLLYNSQYGFRTHHSTEHTVLELQNMIAENINNKLLTAGVFLDLSKAFDTINHSILINKLQFYGIRGVALDWFKSYLYTRKQIVQIGTAKSSPLTLHTGVPQGSNLGPLLFIIYINDMYVSTNTGNVIHFADDTCLLFTFESIQQLQSNINVELANINNWLLLNKLSLNVNKTKCILFHHKSNPIVYDDVYIAINSNSIDITDGITFLGVHLDKHLDWKLHISLMCNKIAKSVHMLNYLKKHVPTSVLKCIYTSLIQPHILYGLIAWYSSPELHLKRLRLLQKKAIRCVFNANYNAHTDPLFFNANVLKLHDLYVQRCIILYWKCKHNEAPRSLCNQIIRNVNIQHVRNDLNNLPKIKLELGRQMLIIKITNVLNTIPKYVKEFHCTTSLNGARFKLKKYLLSKYSKKCNLRNCHPCNKTNL